MRSRGSDAKGLHIDAKHLAQQTSQGVTGEFGNHTRAQPEDGLGQQMFEMAASILEFKEPISHQTYDMVWLFHPCSMSRLAG